MFITDKFVFLHIPKTAGTFVHKVLRELHCPQRWQRKIHSLQRVSGFGLPFFPYRYREVTKHTTRRRIREACDDSRAVVLAVRNPLDHYVSHFRFNWWRRFPARWFRDLTAVEDEFGCIENFGFPQFVRSTLRHAMWSEPELAGRRSLGPVSAEWLRFFCRVPSELTAVRSDVLLLAGVLKELEGVSVLRMESLNSDLKYFLLSVGFAEDKVGFLNDAPRVYPGKKTRLESDRWPEYYTNELAAEVVKAEWMLFDIFPDYLEAAEQELCCSLKESISTSIRGSMGQEN